VVDGFDLRILGPDDAAVLDDMAPDVFDGPTRADSTAAFFASPAHHLAVALDGTCVVGFASGVVHLHPDKPPELFVSEVGVAETHRQRGIASALLRALFDHARALGCAEAWVLTETGNAPARALYRAAGGTEEPPPVYATVDLI